MAKHLDALKSLDSFVAPWETEGGTDAEIEKPKLKRWIHALLTDKAKAQDARDAALETVSTLEKDLADAKVEVEKASPEEANKKIEKLTKQVTDLTAERDGLVKSKEVSDLRAEVLEGVDPKHAKHVKGETREELEASLKEIREDFGIAEPSDGGDDDGDGDDEPPVRTAPRTRISNPADPQSGRGSDAIDFDKVADDILGSSVFH